MQRRDNLFYTLTIGVAFTQDSEGVIQRIVAINESALAKQLPCKAFDAPLLLEKHHTTFINYLRLCIRWGGFPGLEVDNRLSPGELEYLTKDLLPF